MSDQKADFESDSLQDAMGQHSEKASIDKMQEHCMPLEELLRTLGVGSVEVGLSQETVHLRLQREGSNVVTSNPQLTRFACIVRRGGHIMTISASELVRGDIVILEQGSKVPADVRLVKSVDMKVNASNITGEALPLSRGVECTSPSPFETQNLAFCGNIVAQGTGEGIVVLTGNSTFISQIASLG